MKKILLLTHLYPSKSMFDKGTFVHNQVKALKFLGYEITVINTIPWFPRWIPLKKQRWKINQSLSNEEIYSGIKIFFPRGLTIPQKMVHLRGRFYFYSLRRFFKEQFRKNKYDLIHAHTVLPDGDLGYLLKKSFNIPLIITIHGYDLQVLIKENRCYRDRILFVLSNANGIGLVSYKLKKLLNELAPYYKNLPPMEVIYNGIQTYDSYPNINWSVSGGCIRMITISNLIEQKGFYTVFEAMGMLKDIFPNLNYFIIGDGWDKNKLLRKVVSLNLQDRIHFLGAMPHNQAMAYLKDADVFVMPSVNESFGIVYIEAMYFGKITIGSKGEGIEEIIKNRENGFLINPNDPVELKDLLLEILPKIKEANDIKTKAKKSVWPRFSWENNAIGYQNVYDKAIKNFKK